MRRKTIKQLGGALLFAVLGTCISTAALFGFGVVQTSGHAALADSVIVEIRIGEDGYYNLLSDPELEYHDGQLTAICLRDPALLQYAVSSAHGNGVWVLDRTDGEALMSALSDSVEQLQDAGESELAAQLEEAQRLLSEKSTVYTQAST